MEGTCLTLPELYAKHSREIVSLVREALRENGGNLSRTAAALDAPYTTLYRIIYDQHPELAKHASTRVGKPPKDEDA